eukprot:SRR837773.261.p1 GENE.SRR837773.261~~SRR837773.261.p1  ORF type:complete len:333 (-),score=64.82 SRR837773.261:71-997(-)
MGGDDDEGGDGEDAAQDPATEARAAVKDVQKCRREISKLSNERERLQLKMKTNRSMMNKAEKRLEELQAVAKTKTRVLGAEKAKKMRKIMEGKRARARSSGDKAAKTIRAAQKRLRKMKDGLSSVRAKADEAEAALKRAQRTFDEAKKRCADLRKQGEDVPEEGEKDLSAPGAWKPPGIRAAKDRDAAKIHLAKAKAVFAKASAALAAKETVAGSVKERLSQAKEKQQAVEETLGKRGAKASASSMKTKVGVMKAMKKGRTMKKSGRVLIRIVPSAPNTFGGLFLYKSSLQPGYFSPFPHGTCSLSVI